MSVLLDSNVLTALVVADHVHHAAAESWFAKVPTRGSAKGSGPE
jgi:predicted nucleic acid-binding protein